MSESTEPKNSETKSDDKKTDEGKENKDGTVSATIDDVKQIVSEAVQSLKESITGSSDTKPDDTESKSDESEGEKKEPRTRRTYSSIQEDAKAMVKAAVSEVLGDIEHKKEHEQLKVKKAPAQKSPIKVRPSTRFWLGRDYGKDD